jgi:hypothetical protein
MHCGESGPNWQAVAVLRPESNPRRLLAYLLQADSVGVSQGKHFNGNLVLNPARTVPSTVVELRVILFLAGKLRPDGF